MRAIISVGSGDETLSVVHFLSRLKFQNFEGRLLRVLERVAAPLYGAHPALTQDVIERFLKMQEIEELERLAAAEGACARAGMHVAKELRQGLSPAHEILAAADAQQADLLVTGWRRAALPRKVLGGSVNRKLVTQGKQSLLVVRQPAKSAEGRVNVVLATDHSSYMDRCIDVLVQLAPRGIGTLTVLTAYPKSFFEQVMKFQDSFHGDVAAWMESQLESQNQKVISRLASLGCTFSSVVSGESPEAAIPRVLAESSSELLIVGSQGHGFFERLTVGSLSYDAVMTGSTSVLVLRAPL